MSTKSQKQIKNRVLNILDEAGFCYSEECNIYPKSFDYAAKRQDVKLLLKTLVDINNLSRELASRIMELSSLLFATPFLVGRKNHGKEMEPGVVYERHGIKSLNPRTLRDVLVHDIPPLVYAAPGGKYVNLNSQKLKEERLKRGISKGELASKIGVSRSTIRKYEEGKDISVDVAMKLEEELDAPLFESVPLSTKRKEREREEDIQDPILSFLSSLGFDVLPTRKAPFKALTESSTEKFLTGVEAYNKRLKKKAVILSSVSGVIDYRSFMVINEKNKGVKEKIENTPILTRNELTDNDSIEELLSLLNERSKEA